MLANKIYLKNAGVFRKFYLSNSEFKKVYYKLGRPKPFDVNLNNSLIVLNNNELKKVINNTNINHFSFITSISESFLLKNAKKTIEKSDQDIFEMMYNLDETQVRRFPPFVKLYVTCINECPINGKIDNNFIINRLLQLNKMKVDNICLSDTCGTLNATDFKYIVYNCNNNGLPFKRLSLQLRVKQNREKEIEKVIHNALERKITNFDVSLTEMNKNNTPPILSYEQYYKFLINYIKNIRYSF